MTSDKPTGRGAPEKFIKEQLGEDAFEDSDGPKDPLEKRQQAESR